LPVISFNNIGRINDFSDFLRVIEKR